MSYFDTKAVTDFDFAAITSSSAILPTAMSGLQRLGVVHAETGREQSDDRELFE